MKVFMEGDQVINPITNKRSEVVNVSAGGIYLRDNGTPVSSCEYSYIPIEEDPRISVTVDDVEFIT